MNATDNMKHLKKQVTKEWNIWARTLQMFKDGVFHIGTVQKITLFAVSYWYCFTDFCLIISWRGSVRSTFDVYVMKEVNLKWEDSDWGNAEKQ